jgi:polyferredoxin
MSTIARCFRQTRHLFQAAVLVLTLGIGVQFYLYVHQAMGPGPITIQRPAGVEGFLPIGALMGWKHFWLTGRWDAVHPAAMVIFGWAVVLSLLFRKTFCSWFCPVGTVSEGCWRLGRRLFGANLTLPRWIDGALRSLKYLLLGFFLWAIAMMSVDQIAAFMESPYYKLSDVKMLHFFTRMTRLTAIVLAFLLIGSLLIKNLWCRFLCPYGALLGLAAMVGPSRIHRSEARCLQCGRCERPCPARLPISKKRALRSPECLGCLDCTAACPAPETLALCTVGVGRRWSPRAVALAIALSFALTVLAAGISGVWRGSVSDQEVRMRLRSIDAPEYSHPGTDWRRGG